MVYNQPRRFYCGVDLHARSMFTHVLDHKSKTVFEQDLPAVVWARRGFWGVTLVGDSRIRGSGCDPTP